MKILISFVYLYRLFSDVDTASGSYVKSGVPCVHQFSKFMAKFQKSLLCRTEETTKFPRSIVGQRTCKTES